MAYCDEFWERKITGTQDRFQIKEPFSLPQGRVSFRLMSLLYWCCSPAVSLPVSLVFRPFWNPLTTILEGGCYVFVLDCQTIFCFQPIWQKNLATLSVQSLLHIQKWVNEWPWIPRGAGINRLPFLFVLAFKCLCLDAHSSTVMQDSNTHRKFLFSTLF